MPTRFTACDVGLHRARRRVIIVDEFTGRTIAGRRWSDGLHQAVEAKEGVPIQRENQTLATITFQNYFRMRLKKLGRHDWHGRHGSLRIPADLQPETVMIPTHRDMVRRDENDLFFKTTAEKWKALYDDIRDCYKPQPAGSGRHHLIEARS